MLSKLKRSAVVTVFGPCTVFLVAAGFNTPRADNSVDDVETIVRRWTEANRADFAAAAHYGYVERIRTDDGTKTYRVTLLLGTPYRRLIEEDGKPLSPSDSQQQAQDLEDARRQRISESPNDRARRLADYERSREHAHRFIEELPQAFTYTVRSTDRVQAGTVYVLDAAPRQGYDPPNVEGRVLTGMRGQFWIDTRTFQLVRGWARVLHPVSIEGFLATVEPGTEFEVEQQPVAEGIWLPTHFAIHSRSAILHLFHRQNSEDHTYFDYRRSPPS
jgi:hypothetical protein